MSICSFFLCLSSHIDNSLLGEEWSYLTLICILHCAKHSAWQKGVPCYLNQCTINLLSFSISVSPYRCTKQIARSVSDPLCKLNSVGSRGWVGVRSAGDLWTRGIMPVKYKSGEETGMGQESILRPVQISHLWKKKGEEAGWRKGCLSLQCRSNNFDNDWGLPKNVTSAQELRRCWKCQQLDRVCQLIAHFVAE